VAQETKNKHKTLLQQFKDLETEYNSELGLKQARESLAQAKLQADMDMKAELEIKGRAAARIQAQWRGYRTRQAGKGGKDKKSKKKK
jgi:IQ calmodulin-binding motif